VRLHSFIFLFIASLPTPTFADNSRNIPPDVAAELSSLKAELSRYQNFWKKTSEHKRSIPLDSLTSHFAKLGSYYYNGIELLGYPTESGLWCKTKGNQFAMNCFDNPSLMQLRDDWTEKVKPLSLSQSSKPPLDSYWKLRDKINDTKYRQTIAGLEHWLGLDHTFFTDLGNLSLEPHQLGFNFEDDNIHSEYKQACFTIWSGYNSKLPACETFLEKNKNLTDAREALLTDFFKQRFTQYYNDSRFLGASEKVHSVQIAEITDHLSPATKTWLGVNTENFQRSTKAFLSIKSRLGELLTDPNFDSNCNGNDNESLNCINIEILCENIETAPTEKFKQCIAATKVQLDIAVKREMLINEINKLAVARYKDAQRLLTALIQSNKGLLNGFQSLEYQQSDSLSILLNTIKTLESLSEAGALAHKLYSIVNKPTPCRENCLLKINHSDAISFETTIIPQKKLAKQHYRKQIFNDPDVRLFVDKACHQMVAEKLAGAKVDLHTKRIGSSNNDQHSYNLHDLGLRALSLKATLRSSNDDHCSKQEKVTLTSTKNTVWLKPDINLVAAFAVDHGMSSAISIKQPTVSWDTKTNSLGIDFWLSPRDMKIDVNMKVGIPISKGSKAIWIKSINDQSLATIISAIQVINANIKNNDAIPAWLNVPTDTTILGLIIQSASPLTFSLYGHPEGKEHLITEYTARFGKPENAGNSSLQWLSAKPLMDPALAFAISQSKQTFKLPSPLFESPSLEQVKNPFVAIDYANVQAELLHDSLNLTPVQDLKMRAKTLGIARLKRETFSVVLEKLVDAWMEASKARLYNRNSSIPPFKISTTKLRYKPLAIDPNIKPILNKVLGKNDSQIIAELTKIAENNVNQAINLMAAQGGLVDCMIPFPDEIVEANKICPYPSELRTALDVEVSRVFTLFSNKATTLQNNKDPLAEAKALLDIYESPGAGLTNKDIDKALAKLRTDALQKLANRVDEIWQEAVRNLLSQQTYLALEALSLDILSDARVSSVLASTGIDCQFALTKKENSLISERCRQLALELGVRSWGLAMSGIPENDYSEGFELVLTEIQLGGPFIDILESLVSNTISSSIDQTTLQLNDTEAHIYKAINQSKTHLDGELGAARRYAKEKLDNLDLSQFTAFKGVITNLPLIDMGGKIKFSKDIPALKILNGDEVIGIECYSEEIPFQCIPPPTGMDAFVNTLKNSVTDLVQIRRLEKTFTVRLGYTYNYTYDLSPVISDIQSLPDRFYERIDISNHKAVEKAITAAKSQSKAFHSMMADLENNSRKSLQDVLDKDLLGPFVAECSKSFPQLKDSCSDPMTFSHQVFYRELSAYVRQVASDTIASGATKTQDILAECRSFIKVKAQAIKTAAETSCTTLATGLDNILQEKDFNNKKVIAQGLPKQVLAAFGRSLDQSTGASQWLQAMELSYGAELSKYKDLVKHIETTKLYYCTDRQFQSLELLTSKKPDSTHYCFSTKKSLLQRLGTERANLKTAFNRLLEQKINQARKLCVSTTAKLLEDKTQEAQYCRTLEEIAENPDEGIKTLEKALNTAAMNQAEIIAQTYLSPYGLNFVNGQFCLDLSNIKGGQLCGSSAAGLLDKIKKEGKQALLNTVKKEALNATKTAFQPAIQALEITASNLCDSFNQLVSGSNSPRLLGGNFTISLEGKCSSDFLDIKGSLDINGMAKENRPLFITGGVSLTKEALQKAIKSGQISERDFKIEWNKLTFSRSLEDIVKSELNNYSEDMRFQHVTIADTGLRVDVSYKPSKFPFAVPISLKIGPKGFQLNLDNIDSMIITTACAEINQFIQGEKIMLFDGALITAAPPTYCNSRKLRGLELSLSVDFRQPIGKMDLSAFIDAERGLRVKGPDPKKIMFAALFESFGLDYVTLASPFYTYEDSLTLYLNAKMDTSIGLQLQAGFMVSPRRFSFRGPIGLSIPGWFDTNIISFGNLGVLYQPRNKMISLLGDITVVPGTAMNQIVKVSGKGSLSPVDKELTIAGSLRVFTFLELMSSETKISVEDRLFSNKIGTGPMLDDIVRISGLLKIQDKKPKPFFLVAGEGDVFGANIFSMKVRLDRDLSGEFKTLLEIPVKKDSTSLNFSFDKHLSNPQASGEMKLSLSPFDFSLGMGANKNVVSLEIGASPPPLDVSVELPSFETLTPSFLLGLLLDFELKAEIPRGTDFTLSGAPEGDGDDKTASDQGDKPPVKKAKQVIDHLSGKGKIALTRGWKIIQVKYCHPFKIGIRFWCVDKYKDANAFTNNRIKAMAMDINVNLNENSARALDIYYSDLGDYEALISRVDTARFYIFKKNGNMIWKGSYTGNLSEVDMSIVAHKTETDKNLIVVRSQNNIAYAVKNLGIFNGKKYPIDGSKNLPHSAFIHLALREMAAERLWRGRKARLYDVKKPDKWLLVESVKSSEKKISYSILHYDETRNPAMAVFSLRSAKDNQKESKLLKSAMISNPKLALELSKICKEYISSLSNPCAYFVAGNTEWIFGLHEDDGDISALLGWKKGASLSKTLGEDDMVPKMLIKLRGPGLEKLFSGALGLLESDSVVDKFAYNLNHPQRIMIKEKRKSKIGRYIVASEDVSLADKGTYIAKSILQSCAKDYWRENTARRLSATKIELESNKLSFEDTILKGITQTSLTDKLGWELDPLGVMYAECGVQQ